MSKSFGKTGFDTETVAIGIVAGKNVDKFGAFLEKLHWVRGDLQVAESVDGSNKQIFDRLAGWRLCGLLQDLDKAIANGDEAHARDFTDKMRYTLKACVANVVDGARKRAVLVLVAGARELFLLLGRHINIGL